MRCIHGSVTTAVLSMACRPPSVFGELELSDVEDTGEELGRGSYGVVTKVNVKGQSA